MTCDVCAGTGEVLAVSLLNTLRKVIQCPGCHGMGTR